MTKTIEIHVPFAKRHLTNEIKMRGGKFSSEQKTWSLEDTPDNRALQEMIERPVAAPSPTERVKNVVSLSVDLLNALKIRQFKVREIGEQIVIESAPLTVAPTKPIASESESLVIS